MRRRIDSQNSNHLLKMIDNLKDTPLSDLYMLLNDLVVGAQMQGNKDGEYQINRYVQNILDRLPKSFGSRFLFDAYLIQNTLSSWSEGEVHLSNMVIPTYSERWGLEAPVFINSLKSSQTYRFDLIRIPSAGPDDIPSLVDYPWLFHELAHFLISKHGKPILDRFIPEFNKLNTKFRIRAIPDKGIAKTRANNITDEISEKWLPTQTVNEPTWLRELVVDVIALWSLGPAYLEAYEFEHRNVHDPFLLEQEHPPVELRTRSLVEAGERLGWKEEVQKLRALTYQWKTKLPQLIHNRYISLGQVELIDAAINSSTEFCIALKIPRITPAEIDKIARMINSDIIPEESADIIIGAFLVYRKGETIYHEWESLIFKSLVGEIKL